MQARQCAACGTVLTPSSSVCPKCLGSEWKPLELPGEGRLVSWTTIRRAPAGYAVTAPYDVVVVDLAPGIRVTGRMDAGSAPPQMGATVRQVAQEGTCPIFSMAAA